MKAQKYITNSYAKSLNAERKTDLKLYMNQSKSAKVKQFYNGLQFLNIPRT